MNLVEFSHPRLVAIYDAVNPYAPDTQPRFYRDLASELDATTIVDLGCGTGQITCELARRGHRLIGVDPAPAMLDVARRRRGGERVRWIDGGVDSIRRPDADLAIMTGHVAQFFLTDASWHAALTALHGALRPGGHLAFESRNPEAQGWQEWTPAHGWIADDPAAGRVDVWCEALGVREGLVTYEIHYLFATGEEVVAPGQLRFRTEEELARSLADAGFAVERVYGDWDRGPPAPTNPELIVVAATG
jgi:SAM-dependent methyltransferase